MRDLIFSSYFKDAAIGWIVGIKGLMLRTDNGGETWQRYEAVTDKSLYDITFVDDMGWIVGENGTIVHSRDGGNHWEVQSVSADSNVSLMGVAFFNQRVGLIIGQNGIIFRTQDGGATWENSSPDSMGIFPESLLERGFTALHFYDLFIVDSEHA